MDATTIQFIQKFLRLYYNIDVVPTLEKFQKMIDFYHDKYVDLLNLGCTAANRANFSLYKTTDAKFYSFLAGDKDLLEKIREDDVGGPSLKFTRKANVDQKFSKNRQKMQMFWWDSC